MSKKPLRLYNTLTRKIETFAPLESGKVSMYLCGLTVYDHWHLGHALQALVFDSFRRYLESVHEYAVTFVNNYTDIDDKIIRRANEEGVSCQEIAERYIGAFEADLPRLNMHPEVTRPRATETIPEILAFIEDLESKGHAYPAADGVYFDVRSLDNYGDLSGNRLDEQVSGSSTPAQEGLRNPMDFALWKFAKEGEPGWESKWGAGRPGWHIECSAMAHQHLGATFDIHAGGLDLVFPHHENEKAQSEARFGPKSFSRYWMHNGLLRLKGEKMSKSLGNTMQTRILIDRFGSDAIRHFVLSSHYRSPAEYEDKNMMDSVKAIRRIHRLLDRSRTYLGEPSGPTNAAVDPVPTPFAHERAGAVEAYEDALADDFNTPRALAAMFILAGEINSRLNVLEATPGDTDTRSGIRMLVDQLVHFFSVLGFRLDANGLPASATKSEELLSRVIRIAEKHGYQPTVDAPLESLIQTLIDARRSARAEKDFARADRIRGDIEEVGIGLMDSPSGTTWFIKDAEETP